MREKSRGHFKGSASESAIFSNSYNGDMQKKKKRKKWRKEKDKAQVAQRPTTATIENRCFSVGLRTFHGGRRVGGLVEVSRFSPFFSLTIDSSFFFFFFPFSWFYYSPCLLFSFFSFHFSIQLLEFFWLSHIALTFCLWTSSSSSAIVGFYIHEDVIIPQPTDHHLIVHLFVFFRFSFYFLLLKEVEI